MKGSELLTWFLTYGAHSSLLLGAVWLVTRRLVQSHAARDVLWKTALVGGLISSSLQVAGWADGAGWGVRVSVPGLGREESGPSGSTAQPRQSEAGADPAPAQLREATPASAAWAANQTAAPLNAAAPIQTDQTAVRPSFSILMVAFYLWALFATVSLAHLLLARARLSLRLGRRSLVTAGRLPQVLVSLSEAAGIRRRIRLTSAAGLSSPVALGFSEICVPVAALTDLDSEQQRSMLAHELAHLARLDPLWLDAACFLERIFFFQPLNVLARRRIQDAAEYLCDDWAVRRTGSGLNLAKCLVKVAEWIDTTPRAVPVSGMAERRSQLVSRIHRLIENRAMITKPNPRWVLPVAVVLLLVTAAAAPRFTSATPGTEAVTAAQDTTTTVPADTGDESALTHRRSEYRRVESTIRRMVHRMARAPSAVLAPTAPMPRIAPMAAMAPGPVPVPAVAPVAAAPAMAGRRGSRPQDTTSAAVPALLAALKDPEVEVRRAAVQSLGNLEDLRAVPGLIDALKDADAEVRARAAQALGELRDERATDGLIAALKDSNAEVRSAAAQALGELRSHEALSGLTAALRDEVRDVRRSAVNALSQLEDARPVDAMLGALKDSDADIRQTAANALGSMEDHRAVKPLMGLLTDASSDVRQAAAEALGSLQDPQAAEPLATVMRDSDADVRQAAAQALGQMELHTAPQGLLDALKDPKSDVRQAAANSVGQIQDSRAVPALKALLDDSNPDVREAAVDALSEIRDRAALDVLIGALKSKDPTVRKRAAQALGQRDE